MIDEIENRCAAEKFIERFGKDAAREAEVRAAELRVAGIVAVCLMGRAFVDHPGGHGDTDGMGLVPPAWVELGAPGTARSGLQVPVTPRGEVADV